MFENNPLLRGANETVSYTQEQYEELLKCANDELYFAENYCWIQTIDSGYILPNLRQYQKKILKAYSHKRNRNFRKNVILMAPRQSAKTVTTAIHVLHYSLFNTDKNVAIVANKETTAKEILDKVKEIYLRLPIWMQPGIRDGGWNAKGIKLANGMKIITSSSSSSGLRGYTISLLILDEFAFLDKNKAEAFMRSMFPTVSSGEESMIIVTSTPQGLNHFYDIWYGAIAQVGNSDFFPIRVYESEVPRPGGNESFKKKTIETHGILYWNQEYECVSGDTKVTIKDTTTSKVFEVTIDQLITLLSS